MTITIRPTSADRLMVETDGYSDHYRAYVQGAVVCKISAPASLIRSYTDHDGVFNIHTFMADVRCSWDRPAGVRIHSLRWIQ